MEVRECFLIVDRQGVVMSHQQHLQRVQLVVQDGPILGSSLGSIIVIVYYTRKLLLFLLHIIKNES